MSQLHSIVEQEDIDDSSRNSGKVHYESGRSIS